MPRVCQQNAYRTGIYAGLCVAILAVPITKRVGFDKNRITLTAMSSAVVTGYFVSRYAYQSCITTEGFLAAMRHIDTTKNLEESPVSSQVIRED
ncbi:hypothetical protein VKS41_007842 [Umbelopsis sp. WA50703]